MMIMSGDQQHRPLPLHGREQRGAEPHRQPRGPGQGLARAAAAGGGGLPVQRQTSFPHQLKQRKQKNLPVHRTKLSFNIKSMFLP